MVLNLTIIIVLSIRVVGDGAWRRGRVGPAALAYPLYLCQDGGRTPVRCFSGGRSVPWCSVISSKAILQDDIVGGIEVPVRTASGRAKKIKAWEMTDCQGWQIHGQRAHFKYFHCKSTATCASRMQQNYSCGQDGEHNQQQHLAKQYYIATAWS